MKARFAILFALFALSFTHVFSVHVRNVFSSAENPDMVAFLRRYGQSPEAAQRMVPRGEILDCNGDALSARAEDGARWAREYPLGEAGVHPVGVFGPRPTGLERALDAALSSPSPGDPSEGGSVRLSIDGPLQRAAYEALAGRAGAAVAMDPRSGRIFAAASSPGYDPLDPSSASGADDGRLVNRAFEGLYPPGSIFKIFTAAAALEAGEDMAIDCPGAGFVPMRGAPPVRDAEYAAYARRGAKWPGFGKIGMDEAFAHSSNVYFAKLGCGCGKAAFDAMAAKTRLREKCELAASGRERLLSAGCGMPPPANAAELAAASIGQGRLQFTPLAAAMLACAAANDGAIPAPTLLADAPARVFSRPFSARTAARIKTMMRKAVVSGTARGCEIPGLDVCGKTGTAQTGNGADHSWFVCFAPEENPQIAVAVVVENGGFGAEAALPAAKAILKKARERGFVQGNGDGEEDAP